MSNPPPPAPPSPYDNYSYETPPARDSSELLVRLAYIFNFSMAGIDALFGLLLVGVAIFAPLLIKKFAAGGGGAPPPEWVFPLIYGGEAFCSLAVAGVKTIAAFKLKRRSRGAWGWALAAAIVGCLQLWCSLLCVMPLAVGIYTIVVLCRQDVRTYLQGSVDPNGAFPVA